MTKGLPISLREPLLHFLQDFPHRVANHGFQPFRLAAPHIAQVDLVVEPFLPEVLP